MRFERGERQRRERNANDARGLDDPRLMALAANVNIRRSPSGAPASLSARRVSEVIAAACNARPAANADGDNST